MTKTGKPRCMGTIEYHGAESVWTDCQLADGHLGPCMDKAAAHKPTVRQVEPVRMTRQEQITTRMTPVVGWDADGAPV